jgi:protein SCO1/2
LFTKKKIKTHFFAILILLLLSRSLSAANDPFQAAIQKAKNDNLTNVYQAQQGVPYYIQKTLDPIWEISAKTPLVTVSNLNLIDENGQPQSAKLLDGKITFVTFFFASCAGFCSTLIKHLQKLESQIKKNNLDVQFIGISVNPSNDTPDKLKIYFKKMRLNTKTWKLLTGQEEDIYNLARETFSAETFKLPKSKGQVAHSEHFYVIDQNRRLRGVLKGTRIDVASTADNLLAKLNEKQ